jgi:hypothetical protein
MKRFQDLAVSNCQRPDTSTFLTTTLNISR